MAQHIVRILFLQFLPHFFFQPDRGECAARREETLMGYVVKHGNHFVIEADNGDYIVKGKRIELADKLVEATGIIATPAEKT